MANILTKVEIGALLLSLARSREHAGGFYEDEAQKLITWAQMARLDYATLEMVLKGELLIDVVDGKVQFKPVPFGWKESLKKAKEGIVAGAVEQEECI